MGVGGADGEDVPGVFGYDPSTPLRTGCGGDEVDLIGAVGASVVVEVTFVGVPALLAGALDLDAEEASVGFDG